MYIRVDPPSTYMRRLVRYDVVDGISRHNKLT
jgi:hypothetical protein